MYLIFCPTEKLFNQIAQLQKLVSLEIEFLNFTSFNPSAEIELEAISISFHLVSPKNAYFPDLARNSPLSITNHSNSDRALSQRDLSFVE